MLNLELHTVDVESSVLLVKGHVPGPVRGVVRVKDAHRKRWTLDEPPPFPTFDISEEELLGDATPPVRLSVPDGDYDLWEHGLDDLD